MNSATKQVTNPEQPQAVVHRDAFAEYENLRAGMRADMDPQGAMQEALFEQVVHAAWDLRRYRLLEGQLAALAGRGVDPLFAPGLEDRVKWIDRGLRTANYRFYRSLRELRRVQTEKAVRQAEAAILQNAAQPTEQQLPVTGLAESSAVAKIRRAAQRRLQPSAQVSRMKKALPRQAEPNERDLMSELVDLADDMTALPEC